MKLLRRSGIIRRIKERLKSCWHRLFLTFEKLGVHIVPVHFYTGLPIISYLQKHPGQWINRSPLPGIKVNLPEQVQNLSQVCLPFQNEYQGLSIYWDAVKKNGEAGYGEIESQVLHGFVRHYKPRRIIQIGCGLATHCLVHAVGLNGTPCEVSCIEPYPNAALKSLKPISLIEKPVQAVMPELFTTLARNDLLFIDSTHVVQVGSDVNYLVLEILPRLAPGVVVHFHDIYLPYDYPRNFLNSVLFPLETSLVRAFLINNPKAEIIACLSQLHYDRPDALRAIFPDYKPQQNDEGLTGENQEGSHFPSSLWLTVKA